MSNLISCLADIEKIEATPLSEQNIAGNTYDAIRVVAEANPNSLAIRYIEDGEAWEAAKAQGESNLSVDLDYSDLLSGINRTANMFRSLGVGETDVVSMLLPNIPQAHFVLWGGEACGIVNPINYILDAHEIGAIVQSAGTKVLVIMGEHPAVDTAEKLAVIQATAPCVETVLVIGDMPSNAQNCLSFDALLEQQNPSKLDFERNISSDSVASLFHTGGTTGLPKLAQHTHLNEVYTAWAINTFLKNNSNECMLTGLPLFHCNAAIANGLSAFTLGASIILAGINGYRTPGIVKNMFAFIDHYQVTNFTAVPTIYAVLCQLPVANYDLSSLRNAGCGAAPMPVELFTKFKKLTGIQAGEGYGLTEATVVSTMTPTAEAKTPRVGSIGLRIPYTEIKPVIINANGDYERDCKVNEIGTIVIHGPSVTPGYTDTSKNEALFVTDADGKKWLNTGDLARQDGDGYFWLTGRSKELIIRGGHNIDPKTIEEALAQHPAVNLAAAIGRPDSYAGEVPVAYVDTVAQINEDELLEHCKQNIGERAAIPKAIVILDSLPVTGVGKIHKPTLHLMELKAIVEQELTKVSSSIADYDVQTEANAKFGNMANISIKCAEGVEPSVLETQLNELFGSYSFAFTLKVS